MNDKKTKKRVKKAVDPAIIYTLKERIIISAFSVFTFVFVIMLFGPIDIFLNNSSEIPFILSDILVGILLLSFGVMAFFTAYLCLIKSTLINYISAAILILPVGGCFQLLIFGSSGEMTGDELQLSTAQNIMITLFWVLLAGALLASAFFAKKKWKNIVIFASVLMFGMNGASLVTVVMKYNPSDDTQNGLYSYVLSGKNIYNLSSEENIVVLLVDRFDNVFLNYCIDNYPDFSNELNQTLDGFTKYTDAITLYGRTFPSVPYMISGIKYVGETSAEEYLDTVYKKSDFLKDLKSNGYSVNLYLKDHYTYNSGESFLGVADNVEKVESYEVYKFSAANNLICRSISRYIPENAVAISYALNKEPFTFSANFICEDDMYYADDAKYYQGLISKKISTSEELSKNYIFLHLEGSHAPYDIDENCIQSDKETNAAVQTIGCMRLVFEYINQMNELGIYDNSTIIIAGDHGFPAKDNINTLSDCMTTALFIKPRGATGKLKSSASQVSHENLLGTIVKDAGIVTENDYGISIFDIKEGENTSRYFYKINYENSFGILSFSKYLINGVGSKFTNWNLDELIKTEQKWYG